MLLELSMKNIGIIEDASVEFSPGFNVITGETGAGKTMVLSALAIVLGGKGDGERIRSGSERLSVAARFSLPSKASAELKQLLEDHDPEIEDGELLLSRSVTRDGKSRAHLASMSASASVLSDFGRELLEIHGQHATLYLSKTSRQRDLLDRFCGEKLAKVIESYRMTLAEYKELQERIEELESATKNRDSELESLRELAEAAKVLKPRSGELGELEVQIKRAESIDLLRTAAAGVQSALDSEDAGAYTAIQQARRYLSSARGRDPELDSISDRIDDLSFDLGEISGEIERFIASFDGTGVSLDDLQHRRAQLLSFAKRFGKGDDRNESFESAITESLSVQSRINDLSGGDSRIGELREELRTKFSTLRKVATSVTEIRSTSATELSVLVSKELHGLAMPTGKFHCNVTSANGESISDFGASGVDEVSMVFTAHGGELLPINKAASGGELSRLMLAIEVVVAGVHPKETYIFDEIDAGVGGKAALEVGKRLRALSKGSQVIVVTHLPQVALWADHHLLVRKESGAITQSAISLVDGRSREVEIARMLSGVESSEHAQEHARELLDLRNLEVG